MSDPANAAALATADEVLMRCLPAQLRDYGLRHTAAAVIEKDKADLVSVLGQLADALDGNSEVNSYTGEFAVLVQPEWFWEFKRALLHHTGRECLRGVPVRRKPGEGI